MKKFFFLIFLFLNFLILDLSKAKDKTLNFNRLEYVFTHFGVPISRLIIKIEDLKFNNKDCIKLYAYTKPILIFKLFKNISYNIETYIDIEKDKPLRFHKQKRIGKKVIDEFIYFYYPENIAIWKYTGKSPRRLNFKEGAQDLLSIFYYFRSILANQKSEYSFDVLYNGIIFKVYAKVIDYDKMHLCGKEIDVIKMKFTSDLIKYIIKEKDIIIYFDKNNYIPVLFLIDLKKLKFKGFIKNI